MSKVEPISGVRTGCLNCPPKPDVAPLDWDPDPGFGSVTLSCDGGVEIDYMHIDGDPTRMTVQDFEDIAAKDPDHDWRFEIHGPLAGVIYQRHGEGIWHPIKRTEGFA